jgi:hypothetical protein
MHRYAQYFFILAGLSSKARRVCRSAPRKKYVVANVIVKPINASYHFYKSSTLQ